MEALKAGITYIVKKPFTDFYGNVFSAGEALTYVKRHFLPYHGGHTIVFDQRSIYLQEEENQQIIESLAEYLAPVE